jgi:integrase
MARPRSDGLPSREPHKRKLTDQFISGLSSERRSLVRDTKVSGLALAIYPTGRKVFKCVYPFGGRTRWYTIGKADAVELKDARKLAAKVLLKVATGVDPQAERRAARSAGTFEELSKSYVQEYAKKKNKAWAQPDKLVSRFLIPRWGKLQAASITRSDVKSIMASIASQSVANQTVAAASAIFSWAIREQEISGMTVNPCRHIDRAELPSRERVLSHGEIPKFWAAFDDAGLIASTALKVLLLTGQRPGEVTHMRREHIKDNWWELPGAPVEKLGWPGTKNAQNHRVWLPAAAKELIAELSDGDTGFVFANERGKPVRLERTMQDICARLGVKEKVTPHDLRRTHGTMIAKLRFGRDAMNRVQNHKEGGIADVYDRHDYEEENQQIMEAVANKIMQLIEGPGAVNVVQFARQSNG